VVGGLVQALQPPAVPPDAGSVPSTSLTSTGTTAQIRIPAAAPRTASAVPPTLVTLPGVTAHVVRAAVTLGALAIPDDVDQVGWWTGGAGVTSPSGTIVLAGHVDSARQGLGAFSTLRSVPVGTRVRLTSGGGLSRSFVVTGRRSYAKSTGLPSSLYDQDIGLRLVLITCTGAFDPVKRSYEDNLVVYAAPA
jgi:Sortase domain